MMQHMMIDDPRARIIPSSTRRECIRQGWDQYQANGWKAKSPYPEADPRNVWWMNGLEGADQHRKNIGFSQRDVPGWT